MKKLLPPTLFLLCLIGMPIICWSIDSNHNFIYPYNLFGLPLLFAGLGMAKCGKNLFQKLDTNITTFEKPGILVSEGLYKLSRNPMYLGFLIALIGSAILYQGSISSFIVAFLFLIITDRWFIRYEEQEMIRKFGEEYQVYCNNVRRWI